MNKQEKEEKIEQIKEDLIFCKDLISKLCNYSEDQPDLKIGFELGQIQGIILRLSSDVSELNHD